MRKSHVYALTVPLVVLVTLVCSKYGVAEFSEVTKRFGQAVHPVTRPAAFASANTMKAPPDHAPTFGKLTFDDEFGTLDLTRYSTRFWWGRRWLDTGEQQVYVDPSYTGDTNSPLGLNPFSVSNGTLRIQGAIPSPAIASHLEGQRYTSGILTTYNSFNQLYGYFEMRAKLPTGKGFWSAFWMIPKGDAPKPPEIDIVEALGRQMTTLFATSHWMDADNRSQKDSFAITVPDMSATFHRYGVLWTATYIAWYFDGERIAYATTPADMHNPMYLLVCLAIGSSWPGSPDHTTVFPGNMLVDYIRAYALPD